MISISRLKAFLTAALIVAAGLLLVPERAQGAIPLSWCTHSTAQRLEGDVNGDGRQDSVCHDKVTGMKWVALAEFTGLEQRWFNSTTRWCSHVGAKLMIGDVNGDRRADLVCKDSGRVWVDYAGTDYYSGTDYYLNTNWCTHTGAETFVGDQNGDGRADLTCRGTGGWVWIDHADTLGRFGTSDVWGVGPDFELLSVWRGEGAYYLAIRNNGIVGVVESFHCSTASAPLIRDLWIDAGAIRYQWVTVPYSAVVTCSIQGRGASSVELFVSNNRYTVGRY